MIDLMVQVRLIEAFDMDPLAQSSHSGRSFRGELRAARESGLLGPGARIIPGKLRLVAACVESASMVGLDSITVTGELDDLDISRFNDLRRWQRNVRVHEHRVKNLTAPMVLLEWDLNTESECPTPKAVEVVVSEAGEFHGVVYWYQVEIQPGVWHGNAPYEPESKHYNQVMQCTE